MASNTWYKIIVTDSAGWVSAEDIVYVAKKDSPIVDSPADFESSENDGITWTAVDNYGLSLYDLEISTSGPSSGYSILVNDGSLTGISDTVDYPWGNAHSVDTWYRVTVYDTEGFTVQDVIKVFKNEAPGTTNPTDLEYYSGFSIDWIITDNFDLDRYDIYISTTGPSTGYGTAVQTDTTLGTNEPVNYVLVDQLTDSWVKLVTQDTIGNLISDVVFVAKSEVPTSDNPIDFESFVGSSISWSIGDNFGLWQYSVYTSVTGPTSGFSLLTPPGAVFTSGLSDVATISVGELAVDTWYKIQISDLAGYVIEDVVFVEGFEPPLITNPSDFESQSDSQVTWVPYDEQALDNYIVETSITSEAAGFTQVDQGSLSGQQQSVVYTIGLLTQDTWVKITVFDVAGYSVSDVVFVAKSESPTTDNPVDFESYPGATLTWNVADNFARGTYIVETSTTTEGSGYSTLESGGNDAIVLLTINGLTEDTWYRITVTDAVGYTTQDIVFIKTFSPPDVSSPIDTESDTGRQISWDATDNDGLNSYEIFTSTTNSTHNFVSVETGSLSGISDTVIYTVGSLAQDTWYKVVVTDMIGATNYDVVFVAMDHAPIVDTPTDMVFEGGITDREITWTFTDNFNGVSWIVEKSPDGISGWVTAASNTWSGIGPTQVVLDVGADQSSSYYRISIYDTVNNVITDVVFVDASSSANPTVDSPLDDGYEPGDQQSRVVVWIFGDNYEGSSWTIDRSLDGVNGWVQQDTGAWTGLTGTTSISVGQLLQTYYYRITVTDDAGLTVQDTVRVLVSAAIPERTATIITVDDRSVAAFDGTSMYLEVPNHQFSNLTELTVMTMINVYESEKGEWAGIFGAKEGMEFIHLQVDNQNNLEAYVYGKNIGLETDFSQYYGKWLYIVLVVSNSTVALYINGRLANEVISNANVITYPSNGVSIGRVYSEDRYMFGLIDDIIVKPIAISEEYLKQETQRRLVHYTEYGLFGNDISGNGRNLKQMGTIVSTGLMTRFNGASWLESPDESVFDFSNEMTFVTWFNMDKLVSESTQVLFNKEDTYEIQIDQVTGELGWWITQDDGEGVWDEWAWTGFYPEVDRLYHLAFVYDGTNGQVILFIDGEVNNQWTVDQTGLTNTNNPFMIGARQADCGGVGDCAPFNGYMAGTIVDDRAMTLEEVSGLYRGQHSKYFPNEGLNWGSVEGSQSAIRVKEAGNKLVMERSQGAITGWENTRLPIDLSEYNLGSDFQISTKVAWDNGVIEGEQEYALEFYDTNGVLRLSIEIDDYFMGESVFEIIYYDANGIQTDESVGVAIQDGKGDANIDIIFENGLIHAKIYNRIESVVLLVTGFDGSEIRSMKLMAGTVDTNTEYHVIRWDDLKIERVTKVQVPEETGQLVDVVQEGLGLDFNQYLGLYVAMADLSYTSDYSEIIASQNGWQTSLANSEYSLVDTGSSLSLQSTDVLTTQVYPTSSFNFESSGEDSDDESNDMLYYPSSTYVYQTTASYAGTYGFEFNGGLLYINTNTAVNDFHVSSGSDLTLAMALNPTATIPAGLKPTRAATAGDTQDVWVEETRRIIGDSGVNSYDTGWHIDIVENRFEHWVTKYIALEGGMWWWTVSSDGGYITTDYEVRFGISDIDYDGVMIETTRDFQFGTYTHFTFVYTADSYAEIYVNGETTSVGTAPIFGMQSLIPSNSEFAIGGSPWSGGVFTTPTEYYMGKIDSIYWWDNTAYSGTQSSNHYNGVDGIDPYSYNFDTVSSMKYDPVTSEFSLSFELTKPDGLDREISRAGVWLKDSYGNVVASVGIGDYDYYSKDTSISALLGSSMYEGGSYYSCTDTSGSATATVSISVQNTGILVRLDDTSSCGGIVMYGNRITDTAGTVDYIEFWYQRTIDHDNINFELSSIEIREGIYDGGINTQITQYTDYFEANVDGVQSFDAAYLVGKASGLTFGAPNGAENQTEFGYSLLYDQDRLKIRYYKTHSDTATLYLPIMGTSYANEYSVGWIKLLLKDGLGSRQVYVSDDSGLPNYTPGKDLTIEYYSSGINQWHDIVLDMPSLMSTYAGLTGDDMQRYLGVLGVLVADTNGHDLRVDVDGTYNTINNAAVAPSVKRMSDGGIYRWIVQESNFEGSVNLSDRITSFDNDKGYETDAAVYLYSEEAQTVYLQIESNGYIQLHNTGDDIIYQPNSILTVPLAIYEGKNLFSMTLINSVEDTGWYYRATMMENTTAIISPYADENVDEGFTAQNLYSFNNDLNITTFYDFETNLNDVSGLASDLSIVGLTPFVRSPVGYALSLDGIDDYGYVTLVDRIPQDNITMSVNFSPSELKDASIISQRVDDLGWIYHGRGISMNTSGYLHVWSMDQTHNWKQVGDYIPLEVGAWYTVTMVQEGEFIYGYRDGIQFGSLNMTDHMGGLYTGYIEVGDYTDDPGVANRLNGTIDSVLIMDRAISDNEIETYSDYSGVIYNSIEKEYDSFKNLNVEDGLLAHFSLDNLTVDTSGWNAITTTSGSLNYEKGVIGDALIFDGSQYIETTNTYEVTDNGTLSIWINGDIVAPPVSTNSHYPAGFKDKMALIGATYEAGALSEDYSGVKTSNGLLNWGPDQGLYDNQWHNYMASWNSTHIWLLIDGQPIGEPKSTLGIVPYGETAPLNIGAAMTGYGFEGKLDDFRLYNRQLSDYEIFELLTLEEYRINDWSVALPDGLAEGLGYLQDAIKLIPGDREILNNDFGMFSSQSQLQFKHFRSTSTDGFGITEEEFLLIGETQKLGLVYSINSPEESYESITTRDVCAYNPEEGSFACPSGTQDFDAPYTASGETLIQIGTQLVAVTQLYFEQDMNTDIDIILRMPEYYDINFGGFNTATGRTGVSSIEAIQIDDMTLMPYSYDGSANIWPHSNLGQGNFKSGAGVYINTPGSTVLWDSVTSKDGLRITIDKTSDIAKAGLHRFGIVLNSFTDTVVNVEELSFSMSLDKLTTGIQTLLKPTQYMATNAGLLSKNRVSFANKENDKLQVSNQGDSPAGSNVDYKKPTAGRRIINRSWFQEISGTWHTITQVDMGISQYDPNWNAGAVNLVVVRDWGTEHEEASLVQIGVGDAPLADTSDQQLNGEYDSDAPDSLDNDCPTGQICENSAISLQSMAKVGLNAFTNNPTVRIDGSAFGGVYPTVIRPELNVGINRKAETGTESNDKPTIKDNKNYKKVQATHHGLEVETDEDWILIRMSISDFRRIVIMDELLTLDQAFILEGKNDVRDLVQFIVNEEGGSKIAKAVLEIYIIRYVDAYGGRAIRVIAANKHTSVAFNNTSHELNITNGIEIYQTTERYASVDIEMKDKRIGARIDGVAEDVTLSTNLGARKVKTSIHPYSSRVLLTDTAARESIADTLTNQIFIASLATDIEGEAQLQSYLYGWKKVWKNVVKKVKNAVDSVVDAVKEAAKRAAEKALSIKVIAKAKEAVEAKVESLKEQAQQLALAVERFVPPAVMKVADRVQEGLMNLGSALIESVQTLQTKFGRMVDTFVDAVDFALELTQSVAEKFNNAVNTIMDAAKNGLAKAVAFVKAVAEAIVDAIKFIVESLFGLLKKLGEILKSIIKRVTDDDDSGVSSSSGELATQSSIGDNQKIPSKASKSWSRNELQRWMNTITHAIIFGTGINLKESSSFSVNAGSEYGSISGDGVKQWIKLGGFGEAKQTGASRVIYNTLTEPVLNFAAGAVDWANDKTIKANMLKSKSDFDKYTQRYPQYVNVTQFTDHNARTDINPWSQNAFSDNAHWLMIVDDSCARPGEFDETQGQNCQGKAGDIDFYIPVFGKWHNQYFIGEQWTMLLIELATAFLPVKDLYDDIRDAIFEPNTFFRWMIRFILPFTVWDNLATLGAVLSLGFAAGVAIHAKVTRKALDTPISIGKALRRGFDQAHAVKRVGIKKWGSAVIGKGEVFKQLDGEYVFVSMKYVDEGDKAQNIARKSRSALGNVKDLAKGAVGKIIGELGSKRSYVASKLGWFFKGFGKLISGNWNRLADEGAEGWMKANRGIALAGKAINLADTIVYWVKKGGSDIWTKLTRTGDVSLARQLYEAAKKLIGSITGASDEAAAEINKAPTPKFYPTEVLNNIVDFMAKVGKFISRIIINVILKTVASVIGSILLVPRAIFAIGHLAITSILGVFSLLAKVFELLDDVFAVALLLLRVIFRGSYNVVAKTASVIPGVKIDPKSFDDILEAPSLWKFFGRDQLWFESLDSISGSNAEAKAAMRAMDEGVVGIRNMGGDNWKWPLSILNSADSGNSGILDELEVAVPGISVVVSNIALRLEGINKRIYGDAITETQQSLMGNLLKVIQGCTSTSSSGLSISSIPHIPTGMTTSGKGCANINERVQMLDQYTRFLDNMDDVNLGRVVTSDNRPGIRVEEQLIKKQIWVGKALAANPVPTKPNGQPIKYGDNYAIHIDNWVDDGEVTLDILIVATHQIVGFEAAKAFQVRLTELDKTYNSKELTEMLSNGDLDDIIKTWREIIVGRKYDPATGADLGPIRIKDLIHDFSASGTGIEQSRMIFSHFIRMIQPNNNIADLKILMEARNTVGFYAEQVGGGSLNSLISEYHDRTSKRIGAYIAQNFEIAGLQNDAIKNVDGREERFLSVFYYKNGGSNNEGFVSDNLGNGADFIVTTRSLGSGSFAEGMIGEIKGILDPQFEDVTRRSITVFTNQADLDAINAKFMDDSTISDSFDDELGISGNDVDIDAQTDGLFDIVDHPTETRIVDGKEVPVRILQYKSLSWESIADKMDLYLATVGDNSWNNAETFWKGTLRIDNQYQDIEMSKFMVDMARLFEAMRKYPSPQSAPLLLRLRIETMKQNAIASGVAAQIEVVNGFINLVDSIYVAAPDGLEQARWILARSYGHDNPWVQMLGEYLSDDNEDALSIFGGYVRGTGSDYISRIARDLSKRGFGNEAGVTKLFNDPRVIGGDEDQYIQIGRKVDDIEDPDFDIFKSQLTVTGTESIDLDLGTKIITLKASNGGNGRLNYDIHPDVLNAIALSNGDHIFAMEISPGLWIVNEHFLKDGDLTAEGKQILMNSRTFVAFYFASIDRALTQHLIKTGQVLRIVDPNFITHLGSDWEHAQTLYWGILTGKLEASTIYDEYGEINLFDEFGQQINPNTVEFYDEFGNLIYTKGVVDQDFVFPGSMTGSSTFEMAVSSIWFSTPRSSRIDSTKGGSKMVLGGTERDMNPNDLLDFQDFKYTTEDLAEGNIPPGKSVGDVNEDILNQVLGVYQIPIMEGYKLFELHVPEDVLAGMTRPTGAVLPEDNHYTYGYNRLPSVTDVASTEGGLRNAPPELKTWLRLGQEYSARRALDHIDQQFDDVLFMDEYGMLPSTNPNTGNDYWTVGEARIELGTRLEYEDTEFSNYGGILPLDPDLPRGINPETGLPYTNAEAFWALSTPEIKGLLIARLQSVYLATQGGVGMSTFFSNYFTQPNNIDISADNLLVGVYASAMKIIDALVLNRRVYSKTNAINWDLNSQADAIAKTLEHHPEYMGSYSSIIYGPLIYRPDNLIPPSNYDLAKAREDISEDRIITRYLMEKSSEMLGGLDQQAADTLIQTVKPAGEQGQVLSDWAIVSIVAAADQSTGQGARQVGTIGNDDAGLLNDLANNVIDIDIENTNTLGKQILMLFGSLNSLDNSASSSNRALVDAASDMFTSMIQTTETAMDTLSVDVPSISNNRGSSYNNRIDFHRSTASGNFYIRPPEGKVGSGWGSLHHKAFLNDWKFAFIADGKSDPLFITDPTAWNHWLDGVDISSGYTDPDDPTNGYKSIIVRMKPEFQKRLGAGKSLEGYFFYIVDPELGIIARRADGRSNLKPRLVLSDAQLHLMMTNTAYSMVSRFGRPYGIGTMNTKYSDGVTSTVFPDWDLVQGGMQLRINSNGNLELFDDPQVVWGTIFPDYTNADWALMKSNFEDATGLPFTTANVMGYTAFRIDNSGNYVVRVIDLKVPDDSTIAQTPDDLVPGAENWEHYGHYWAYYNQPHRSTLDSLLNEGMKTAKPYDGVQTDPILENVDPDDPTKIFYIRFADADGRKSIQSAITTGVRDGRTLLFSHWQNDKSTRKMIQWIHTVEGNWGSAPRNYIIFFVGFTMWSLVFAYQVRALTWIFNKLSFLWEFADRW